MQNVQLIKPLNSISRLNLADILAITAIAFSCLFIAWPLQSSYTVTTGGVYFSPAFHDSLWHLALMYRLDQQIPPLHPGLSATMLTNYHYLSDLILLFLAKLTGLSFPVIYFKLAPWLVLPVFVGGLYRLTTLLGIKKTSRYIAILFVLLSGNLSWIIPLLKLPLPWGAQSFMLDQISDQLTNIHTYLGFGLFTWSSVCWLQFLRSKPLRYRYLLLSGLLTGLSFGIKTYAGVVGFIALFFGIAVWSWQKHTLKPFLVGVVPASGLILFFTSIIRVPPGSLIWAPGWLLVKMAADSDRLGLPGMANRLAVYQNSVIKLGIFQILLLPVYFLGNLGVRVLGVIELFNQKLLSKIFLPWHGYLAAAIFVSLLTPIFFRLAVTPYNIIQFAPYSLICLSLLTIRYWDRKFTGRKWLVLFLILTVSLPSTIKTFSEYIHPSGIEISHRQMSALEYIRTKTAADAVFLTHPGSLNFHYLVIPGLSGRITYFSGDTFADLVGLDYTGRWDRQQAFFYQWDETTQRQFLIDAKINYIYLSGNNKLSLTGKSQNLSLETVFQNPEVIIYQVKP